MIKLSLLPRVGSMWTNFLRDIEDLPTSLKGEQLTDLLESEPIRRRLRVEFCTHGRCFGNDVTNVTIRSQCFRTAGVFDLPGSPLSSGPPSSTFFSAYLRPPNVLCFIMGGAGANLICSASLDVGLIRVG